MPDKGYQPDKSMGESTPPGKKENAEKKLKNLKPWTKGNAPKSPGRPKGSYNASTLFKFVTGKETPKVILERLKAAGINPSHKDLESVIAFSMAARAASGNQRAAEYIFDRIFGKAEQSIKANVLSFDATTLNEEAKQLAKELGLIDLP